MVKIALDDGHGMQTAGKRTPFIPELGRFVHENEFNKAVVNYLDIELKRCGFETLLVAPTDADTSLAARTNLANSKRADAYISIHYDAVDAKFDGEGKDPEGHTVFIYLGQKDKGSGKLASCVLKYLNQGTPQKNRGIKEANFQVLRETNMIAILSENGFMDNKKEALWMVDPKFQKEVAVEHAKGICEYFGVAYKGEVVNAPTQPKQNPAQQQQPQTTQAPIKGIGILNVIENTVLRKDPVYTAEIIKSMKADESPNGAYTALYYENGWYNIGGWVSKACVKFVPHNDTKITRE
jgi:N-acetylmuramoyl-L-alanine amidase